METVEIPGGTAQIREVGEMTVRQKRLIQTTFLTTSHIYMRLPSEMLEAAAAKGEKGADARRKVSLMMATLPLSNEEAEALLGQQDSAIVAFLAGWSLDRELPTMENVQDLAPDVYDALAEAVAAPAAKLALGTVNMDPVPREVDPNAPFGESETSNTDSKTPETLPQASIGKRQKDGVSTATASSTA